MCRAFRCRRFVPLALIVLLGAFSACDAEKGPIVLGFLGPLTGKGSELGVSLRNGVILFIELANRSGGIGGRSIELYTVDDEGDPFKALQGFEEFARRGIIGVLGPATGTVAAAVVREAERREIVLVSPTVGLDRFSKRDDYFFRIYPSSGPSARLLALAALNKFRMKRLGAVLDLGNRIYSEEWFEFFSETFRNGGGLVNAPVTFISRYDLSFEELATALLKEPSDGIAIVAGAADSALLCQQLVKRACRGTLFVSDWATLGDLVEPGGAAVEGIVSTHSFDEEHPRGEAAKVFIEGFENRYGARPVDAACFGYDAALALVEGLRRTENLSGRELKAALGTLGILRGARGDFAFDQWGDVTGTFRLVTIADSQMRTLP